MGISDAPQTLNLVDVYPEGTPFRVIKAWVEGLVKTQYGDRMMAKVLVEAAPDDQGERAGSPQEFSVWGSLCEQVQQQDEDELPALLTLKKDGKRWLFSAVEEPSAEEELADRSNPAEAGS
jgi:hypothetical protein